VVDLGEGRDGLCQYLDKKISFPPPTFDLSGLGL